MTVVLFGTFDVRLHGERILRWRAGRSRNLFQYLLVHLNTRVTSERLHEVLWPETQRRPGAGSLKVACHGLRTVLGASRDGSGPIRLLHRDFGYVLEVDDVWIDVVEFERLVDAGLRAARSGRSHTARRDLDAAMRLYAGDFLEGETAEWVIAHREHLKSLAMRALQALRRIAEGDADVTEMIELCHRTLGLDRYHEPSYRALVALHGQLGERERASSWFRLCVQRLQDGLGVAPEPATVAAYRRAFA